MIIKEEKFLKSFYTELQLKHKCSIVYNDGYISVSKHPKHDIYIYNYTNKTQYEKFWTQETLMCRGLVLNENNDIIARPFNKFFNYEEVIYQIPNEPFEVYEKLDGSLGIIFLYKNDLIIATRGSFTSEQSIKSYEIIKKYPKFLNSLKENYTYLVEIIYPENRICVDYNNIEELFLLAIIETNGNELPYQSVKSMGYDIPVVSFFDGIKDFEKLKALNYPNKEGFVVKFENGFRMKIKFENYIKLHYIITHFNDKTIWEYLKDGKRLDDLIKNIPDEFYEKIKKTKQRFLDEFNYIKNDIENSYNLILRELPINFNRKDFAKKVMELNPEYFLNILEGNGICEKCGKPFVYTGDVPDGGFMEGLEPYCTCNVSKQKGGMYGWICPKCGAGLSPFTTICPCSMPKLDIIC